MSDIKLFRIAGATVSELKGQSSDLEKPLQTMIEQNLQTLLGIRFLATEYSTGKTHAGRIDTLGIDENACPVIIEYKRSMSENVINQGLFYLDWLMDHRAEFHLLVLKQLGPEAAEAIDWTGPRLICIASDFTKYDDHAVQQINRNIQLIRYRKFGTELLLLELAGGASVEQIGGKVPGSKASAPKATKTWSDMTVTEGLTVVHSSVRDLFDSLEVYLLSLGDDVQRKDTKLYIAFKRLKNFVTVEVHKEKLLIHAHVDPTTVDLVPGFTRDTSNIGHWGTGDLEIAVRSMDELDRAKPLLDRAYEGI
jgi:predicted transport protein